MSQWIAHIILYIVVPLLFTSTILYVFLLPERSMAIDKKYRVSFKLKYGKFKIGNIKRGASVIGSAGSGKTESVIYNFLQHFSKHKFCGILHDYKDFELTEIAYPLFKKKEVKFYTIAFDQIIIVSILLHQDTSPMRKVLMNYPRYSLKTFWSLTNLQRIAPQNSLMMPLKV